MEAQMGMDVSGIGNPDAYFRANVWSWRPIHNLCEIATGREYPAWAFNDGAGLQTAEECKKLADALEKYLKEFPLEEISLESACRVDEKGFFLPKGATGGKSAYSTSRSHVEEFIKFLRVCNGFEIY
jgi:hypothetical protein